MDLSEGADSCQLVHLGRQGQGLWDSHCRLVRMDLYSSRYRRSSIGRLQQALNPEVPTLAEATAA